jgi:hypothetical protein
MSENMMDTRITGSLKLSLVFFIAALTLLAGGVSLGTYFGLEIASARCYEIKAERCLGEPLVTECVCNEEDREATVEEP